MFWWHIFGACTPFFVATNSGVSTKKKAKKRIAIMLANDWDNWTVQTNWKPPFNRSYADAAKYAPNRISDILIEIIWKYKIDFRSKTIWWMCVVWAEDEDNPLKIKHVNGQIDINSWTVSECGRWPDMQMRRAAKMFIVTLKTIYFPTQKQWFWQNNLIWIMIYA